MFRIDKSTYRMAEKLGKYKSHMAKNLVKLGAIYNPGPSDHTDGPQPVGLSQRNKAEFEENEEDCYILEFDPSDELNFSKLSVSDNVDDDVQFIAHKGLIACRDFPHPRHLCAAFPFGVTPHESHCEQCYCYVCDLPAPCKKWVGGMTSHCHAFDNDRWSPMRTSMRQENALPPKRYESLPRACVITPQQEINSQVLLSDQQPARRENNRVIQQEQQQEQLHPGAFLETGETEEARIYVWNLPLYVDSQKLKKFFTRAGVVKVSKVIYDRETHQSRGSAFVIMSSVRDAEKAVSMYNGPYPWNVRSVINNVSPGCPGVKYTYRNKILVGNLSLTVDVKRLKNFFQEHGDVVGYKVMNAEIDIDQATAQKRSFCSGFVLVESREYGMEHVIVAELHGLILDGRAILTIADATNG